MKTIPESIIEIREHNDLDYKPLVDYQTWRVALMNYTPDLKPEKIVRMQKHIETDEVFVLLAGKCILFLGEGDGDGEVNTVYAVEMELYKLYNIKRGIWHSHTFSPDARVLIVENKDTTIENSPVINLTAGQTAEIVSITKEFWH